MEHESSREMEREVESKVDGATKVVDGVKYRRVDTGYTLRSYYYHSTESGPGPGWDSRMSLLDEEYAMRRFGRTFSEEEIMDPSKLPEEPIYEWQAISDEAL